MGKNIRVTVVNDEAWFAAADLVKVVRNLQYVREAGEKALDKEFEPGAKMGRVPKEVYGKWTEWVMLAGAGAVLHLLADDLERLWLQAIDAI